MESGNYRKFITAVKDVTSGARIVFSKETMSCIAVDAAQVNLMRGSAMVKAFEGDETNLILDIGRLSSLPTEDVLFEYDTQLYARVGRARYNIPILVAEAIKEFKMPNLHHSLVFTINPKEFYDGVKAVSNVYGEKDSAEYVILTFENNEFVVTDKSEYECVVTYDSSDIDIMTPSSERLITKLSIDYVLKTMGRIKDADILTIHLGIDYPLQLDGAYDNTTITYLIAPRIDVI